MPKRGPRFILIPVPVIDGQPTGAALLTYAWLAWHADASRQCHPSVATLARATGLGRRTIQRSLAELIDAGHIEASPSFDETRRGKERQTSNKYRLIHSLSTNSQGGRHERHGGGVTHDTGGGVTGGAPIKHNQLEAYISSVVSSCSDHEALENLERFGPCLVYLARHDCRWTGGLDERHLLEVVEQWALFFGGYSAESVMDVCVLFASNRPGGWWPSPAQVLKKATEY